MSSCSRSTSALSYLMGELDEDNRVLFEKHLNGCPICRHELMLERTVQNGLVACTMPDKAPAELKLNVLTTILTVQRPRFPFWQIAVTLLSGVAVFLILLQILRDSSILANGIGFITGFIDEFSTTFDSVSSKPLMIGIGIVLVGIASVVALLVPEE